ncbi:sporulation integral membrane protein YtvI [Marasmitruncus massiliensis]|uniref:sporulation integral membrane protein YtvI n=1 Tax=Marasmitruncus massiliensis TaxID=1944642 RepID=UPI000C7AB3A3|nr:sporulation integral membrane protein YtvI [Marasmitruncus massiliensis]
MNRNEPRFSAEFSQTGEGANLTIEKKRAFLINCLFTACILTLAYLCFKYLLAWMLPFVIGLITAACLQRTIHFLAEKTHQNKRLLSPIVAFILVSTVGILFVLLVYNAANELGELINRLPGLYQSAAPAIADVLNRTLESIVFALPDEMETQIRALAAQMMADMQSNIIDFSTSAVAWAANKASLLPSVLISIIITVVATFFMTVEFDNIIKFCKLQIPEKYRAQVISSWNSFSKTVVGMLSSYLLIMFITFVELSAGLILLKVNYAVLLAAMISLVDILPVLGTGTILIPWGIIAMMIGKTSFGAGILGIYFGITIIRNILEPRIIGKRIGLHPLVTLMFMYLGLHVLGLLGMFLFPLTVIILKNLQDSGVVQFWKTEKSLNEPNQ